MKSWTETWLSQSREKIRSSRVTTRDGCTTPFKGHGGKTNNESRAVSPPLQKEEKSLREFKRLCGIFCYFSSEQKCWQGKRWNYISYSWSGTRPQAKKGNVLLNVTYWRDGEQRGCEKEERRQSELEEEIGRGGRERGNNDMLMKSRNHCARKKITNPRKQEMKTCSTLNFKIATVLFIRSRELPHRLSIIRYCCSDEGAIINIHSDKVHFFLLDNANTQLSINDHRAEHTHARRHAHAHIYIYTRLHCWLSAWSVGKRWLPWPGSTLWNVNMRWGAGVSLAQIM